MLNLFASGSIPLDTARTCVIIMASPGLEYAGAPFIFSLLTCSALCASRVRELRRRAEPKKKHKGGKKNVASSKQFPIYEIGVVKSCFRECRGTPRQGSFAPSTKGKIVFHKRVPYAALEGLENFSHVWVLFIFHQNTNIFLSFHNVFLKNSN